MPNHNKMTILPLHHCDWELQVPIKIASDLTIENVEGLLRPENFDLWRDYISKQQRDDLLETRIGIVHRFSSTEHVGKPESDSQEKIGKVFILLRLVKPTRLRYSHIQLSLKDGKPDVFSFAHGGSLIPNTPFLQTFNIFHQDDLSQLPELLPKFLKFSVSAPWHLTRAVRFLEAGYSQIADPLLQFVTWTIGIESLFSEDKGAVLDHDLIRNVEALIGAETNIYSEAERSVLPKEPTPLLVGEVLPEILEVRNAVVHGMRVPPRFDDRTARSPATGEPVHYVDQLREGASFILRKLSLKAIRTDNA